MNGYWEGWEHGFALGLCVGMLVYHNVVGWLYLPLIGRLEDEIRGLKGTPHDR